jgi:HlyD family secretion protein
MRRLVQNRLLVVIASCLAIGTAIGSASAKDKKPRKESAAESDKSKADSQKSKEKGTQAKAEKENATAGTAGDEAASTSSSAVGKTHAVARGPFKVQVELDGTVAATHASAVSLSLDESVQLRIRDVVPHGTRVTKGQTLVRFDTTKIDEQIRDLEASKALAELNLKQARLEAELIAKTAPLDTKLAERAKSHAEEDLARYEKIDRAFQQKASEFNVQRASNFLEYVQEELKQLEKMYKADDLTEETEEIVLKRARNNVDQMKFFTEMVKYEHDRDKEIDLPRSLAHYQHAAALAALMAEKARSTTPQTIEKEKLEVEKLHFEQKKAADHLDRLTKDRAKLAVTAPIDGVLYYGRWHANKWTGSTDTANKLHVGHNIQAQDVVFTIVEPGSVEIQAVLPEKELNSVKPGMAGRFSLASSPRQRLDVKVEKVSAAPLSEGDFGAVFSMEGKTGESPVPGMTGTLKIVSYFKADAIAVPSKAVFHDEADDDKRYVLVVDKKGKSQRRSVTVGRENDESIEITDGLSVGDKILLEKPDDDSNTAK